MVKFTLKTQNVNNNTILLEIREFVDEVILNFNVVWGSDQQRDTILEVLDEHMQDLEDDNKIEQWNIICDKRNNKRQDIEDEITHLDIEYKQRNCYNITKLKYIITS